jgi:hypothetical protein
MKPAAPIGDAGAKFEKFGYISLEKLGMIAYSYYSSRVDVCFDWCLPFDLFSI